MRKNWLMDQFFLFAGKAVQFATCQVCAFRV